MLYYIQFGSLKPDCLGTAIESSHVHHPMAYMPHMLTYICFQFQGHNLSCQTRVFKIAVYKHLEYVACTSQVIRCLSLNNFQFYFQIKDFPGF